MSGSRAIAFWRLVEAHGAALPLYDWGKAFSMSSELGLGRWPSNLVFSLPVGGRGRLEHRPPALGPMGRRDMGRVQEASMCDPSMQGWPSMDESPWGAAPGASPWSTTPDTSPWATTPGASPYPSPSTNSSAYSAPSSGDTFDPRFDLGGWMLADSWKYPDPVTELNRRGIVI